MNLDPPHTLQRTYAMYDLNLGLSAMSTASPSDPMSAPSLPTSAVSSSPAPIPPIIQCLYDNIYEQSLRIGEQSKTIERLYSDLNRSNMELMELQAQYKTVRDMNELLKNESDLKSSSTSSCLSPSSISLSPSDSASQTLMSESPTLINRPINRPFHYPAGVIWQSEDLEKYTDVKVSDGNRSRPPVRKCIRTEDGLPISGTQWTDIQHSATSLVQEILHPLVQGVSTDVPFRKKYFKSKWPTQWQEVVTRLEARQPLLQLCALHWKAEMVIVNALDASAGKIKQTLPVAVQAVVPPPSVLPPAPSQDAETTRPDSPPPMSSASVVSRAQSFMSPLKHSKHKITPMSRVELKKKRRCTTASCDDATDVADAADAPATANTVVSTTVDEAGISSIKVPASYESLKLVFTDDPDYNSVPNGLCLLEALHELPETPEALSSPAVQEFLAGIEHADPYSPDVDEDNTNASWGHGHFGSGIGFNGLTWEQVASKQTAYRILAATIKTCRIARQLCLERRVSYTSILANIYLQVIVENLWKHFEAATESSDVSTRSSDILGQDHSQDPDSGSLAASETREWSKIKKLRANKLKALVEKLSISVSARNGKRISKDYFQALAPVSLTEINKYWSEILEIPKE